MINPLSKLFPAKHSTNWNKNKLIARTVYHDQPEVYNDKPVRHDVLVVRDESHEADVVMSRYRQLQADAAVRQLMRNKI